MANNPTMYKGYCQRCGKRFTARSKTARDEQVKDHNRKECPGTVATWRIEGDVAHIGQQLDLFAEPVEPKPAAPTSAQERWISAFTAWQRSQLGKPTEPDKS